MWNMKNINFMAITTKQSWLRDEFLALSQSQSSGHSYIHDVCRYRLLDWSRNGPREP